MRRQSRHHRRGQSLLELVAAGVIVATALTPALRLMRDSLKINRDLEATNLLTTLCVSKLEEVMSQTAGTWATTDLTGDYTTLGYSNVRFSVTRRDGLSDGGIPNRLVALQTMVWDDANNNGLYDTSEKRVQYETKLSKTASYDYEARGM
jgi:type II secretory pathway pseudopilin PulG